ncbi:D-alanyl-D-alanine carboxypeptidase/D-alanyl-D-alanine endopeptidase [Celerinatantimonas diazotrophica]|nr:D-alanyl-D-alanine carboxypeptidase/D-alanyl-D-alanine-endopeptidase [Celerinatantimonas diazotrophica]
MEPPPGSLVQTIAPWQNNAHQQYLVKPASITKLLTATAAWQTLGPKFVFKTSLHYRKIAAHQADVQLVFSGDPTLKLDDLINLIGQLKRLGITQIRHFQIDDSRYGGHQWGLGQVWNDHGICFAAPINAAIVDHNCVLGNLKPTEIGQPGRLYVASFAGVSFSNQTITTKTEDNCEPLHAVNSDNHFRLYGCIGEDHIVLPLAFSVVNVPAYITALVKKIMADAHIDLVDKIRFAKVIKPYPNMFTHSSQPLSKLLHTMLKHSDNVIADSLTKQLAYVTTGRSGTFKAGVKVIWQVLAEHHIDRENQVLNDGSGLSRENLIYPETVYKVLRLWLDNPKFHPLIANLPVAGVDGTLRYRSSVMSPPLRGHIIAKTGSMNGVSNLAGFLKIKSQLVPFVIMSNQVSSSNPNESAVTIMKENETKWLTNGMIHYEKRH